MNSLYVVVNGIVMLFIYHPFIFFSFIIISFISAKKKKTKERNGTERNGTERKESNCIVYETDFETEKIEKERNT